MILKLSPEQEQQVRTLIPTCCNWEDGRCLKLDMPCPQQLSASRVNCIYFRSAVLPGHPELYKTIIQNNAGGN